MWIFSDTPPYLFPVTQRRCFLWGFCLLDFDSPSSLLGRFRAFKATTHALAATAGAFLFGSARLSAYCLRGALLHKSGDGRGFPLPRTDLSHGFCDGYAERGEAVQDGHTDLELGDLTIEVPCAQPLAQQFQTMHLGFDAAPAVVTAPSSPNGSTEAFRRAKCLVPRDCPRCVGLPRLGVFAGRYDGRSTAGGDGVVALAGVEGAVGGDAGDLLIGRDLVEQFRQHGRVTDIAGGELGCEDFQCLLINSDVDLAPDAPFGTAVLARVPLPFALYLDPCAVHQQVQRPV